MASTEQMRRRMEKRRDTKPKGLSESMQPLGAAQFQAKPQEKSPMDILYAKCKRLAGRAHLIGSTPFRFDVDGICKFEVQPGRPSNYDDYATLLRQNGVTRYDPVVAARQAKEAAEAKTVEAVAVEAPAPLPPAPEPEPEPEPAAPEAPAEEPTTGEPEKAASSSADDKPKSRRRSLRKSKNKNEEK